MNIILQPCNVSIILFVVSPLSYYGFCQSLGLVSQCCCVSICISITEHYAHASVHVLFLLSEGKLLSGAGGKKALRSTYVFGLPAAVLWMTYVISNTVLIIAGRGYATEMPYVIQLAMLCLSVHSLCLLLTVSGQRASAKAESNLEENALKDT